MGLFDNWKLRGKSEEEIRNLVLEKKIKFADIPEEKRTERVCLAALDINPENVDYIPLSSFTSKVIRRTLSIKPVYIVSGLPKQFRTSETIMYALNIAKASIDFDKSKVSNSSQTTIEHYKKVIKVILEDISDTEFNRLSEDCKRLIVALSLEQNLLSIDKIDPKFITLEQWKTLISEHPELIFKVPTELRNVELYTLVLSKCSSNEKGPNSLFMKTLKSIAPNEFTQDFCNWVVYTLPESINYIPKEFVNDNMYNYLTQLDKERTLFSEDFLAQHFGKSPTPKVNTVQNWQVINSISSACKNLVDVHISEWGKKVQNFNVERTIAEPYHKDDVDKWGLGGLIKAVKVVSKRFNMEMPNELIENFEQLSTLINNKNVSSTARDTEKIVLARQLVEKIADNLTTFIDLASGLAEEKPKIPRIVLSERSDKTDGEEINEEVYIIGGFDKVQAYVNEFLQRVENMKKSNYQTYNMEELEKGKK